MTPQQPYLAICVNRRLTDQSPSCGGRGAERLARQLEQAMQQHGIDLPLRHSDCLGRCQQGPNLRLAPQGKVLSLDDRTNTSHILTWLMEQLD